MKKLFCLFLCVVVIACLFSGCKKEQKVTLQVGYGRVDITPKYPVPMAANLYSTGAEEHIYSTCLAFKDSTGNTVLLFHNDLIGSPADPIGFAIRDISKATGVSEDNVMVAATHVHRAPRVSWTTEDSMVKYNKQLRGWMKEAAVAAIADLKDTEVYTTSVETEGMNFLRHYIMNDGSVAGDNFGSFSSGFKDQVGDADNEMQLIKFVRKDCKDIVLVNYQMHPHRARGEFITADIVGAMREELEAKANCQFIYFTGASGNVNPHSKIGGENATSNYVDQGKGLAKYAMDADSTYQKVDAGKVQIQNYVYKGKPAEGKASCADLYMYVFSIGDVAFVMAPYEMFSENGEQIKAGSQFKNTIVCTLSRNTVSYIPSYDGYEYDGKLSYEGTCCEYARGTAEELVEQYVKMLAELYKTK